MLIRIPIIVTILKNLLLALNNELLFTKINWHIIELMEIINYGIYR